MKPIVEGHAHAADQRQATRTRRVPHHRHGRNGRKAEDAVRPVRLGGIGVGGGDDLVRLVPFRPHKAAMAAQPRVAVTLRRGFDDALPGRHRRHRDARLAPQLHQTRADQRVLHPVAGIEIPAVRGAARTAARFMVRQVRPGARIVGLLRLPGDDAALDVDLPGAGAGAVRAVGRAHDLVVLPALAIAVFPTAVLRRGDAVTVREGLGDLVEEG